MIGKIILGLISVLIIVLMLFYLVPFKTTDFTANTNNNFSRTGNSEMQFYPNLRFPSSDISYKILNCPLKKQNEMEYAFEIMQNLTSLNFHETLSNEQILITCEEKNKIINGLFIAGEGGPTNITVAGNFNVISFGEIMLIRNSDCPKPNVALHELLHVLGFKHSENPDNIMYNLTQCSQTISNDIINEINNLYSFPSNPDLSFENASASMNGRFLSLELTVFNGGLENSPASKVKIYADEKIVKEINLAPLEIGRGILIEAKNIWVSQVSVQEIELAIESDFNEINKENNKIKLEIKNKS
jgi:hypothetical protein